VVRVSANVTDFAAGSAVFSQNVRSFAVFVVVEQGGLTKRPTHLRFEGNVCSSPVHAGESVTSRFSWPWHPEGKVIIDVSDVTT
jgi:NADPH:quinone reductase-like Zn-dependent oxidoreductase